MKILIVDNDKESVNALEYMLVNTLSCSVDMAEDIQQALDMVETEKFDLVISNLIMPDNSGLYLLQEIKKRQLSKVPEVIFCSIYSDSDKIVKCFREGAADFLPKPLDVRYLLKRIQELMSNSKDEPKEHIRIADEHKDASEDKSDDNSLIIKLDGMGKIGFFDSIMREIRDYALKLHKHEETSVMIQGETGTGKEIIARLIHYGIDDKEAEKKPFICLNCSSISPSLFESELFGYEGGAFTGADPKGRKGKLELAAGGTIFLDEIGDMPQELQPKLLRALQEKKFYRISGNKEIALNARIICATNRNLLNMIDNDEFRKDLYYRLNTADIYIPPLRERKDAIIPMAMMFLDELTPENSKTFSKITEEAKEMLKDFNWQGNVRELQTAMERIVFRYNDVYLQTGYLENAVDESMESRKSFFYLDFPEEGIHIDEVLKMLVQKAMRLNNNNITQTAKYLKTTRNRVKRIVGLM